MKQIVCVVLLMMLMAKAATLQTLPATYDLRNVQGVNYVTTVKSQQGGTCWTHGAMAAMEGNLLMTGTWAAAGEVGEPDLAEYHLDWWNGFNEYFNKDVNPPTGTGLTVHMGGDYRVTAAYTSRGDGAVRETDAPNYSNPHPLLLPSYHRYYPRHIEWYTLKDSLAGINIIKQKIIDYGVMGTCMDYNGAFIGPGYTHYQPISHHEDPNHAIAIVGWDDNKVTQAPFPGAWLCKNSWGSGWGNAGYFWISYYDKHCARNLEMGAISFIDVVPFPYHRVYYHDYHGWRDTKDSVHEAFNAFVAQDPELISSVSFYTAVDSVDFRVLIFGGFSGGQLKDTLSFQQGFFAHTGFHTVDLASPVKLKQGDPFFVHLWLSDGGQPFDRTSEVPVLLGGDSRTIVPSSASPGESYFLHNGQWIDLTTVDSTANFCIKALTVGPLPEKPALPTGALPLYCNPVDSIQLTVPKVANTDTLIWHVSPQGAATVVPDSAGVILLVATGFKGELVVLVEGGNAYGTGAMSDTLLILVGQAVIPGMISGDTMPVSAHISTYSVPVQPGVVWNWNLTGGVFLSGTSSNVVDVEWTIPGQQQIMVSGFDGVGCHGDTSVLMVEVIPIGIDHPIPGTLSIYPNPAQDLIRISGITDGCHTARVTLYNTMGQQLLSRDVAIQQGIIGMDLPNLANGTFFAAIKACDTNFTIKFVVQHVNDKQ